MLLQTTEYALRAVSWLASNPEEPQTTEQIGGRSLRDFDLKRRMFRYPCSYMIYSEAFDSLPDLARERIYRRLWKILTGKTRRHLLAPDHDRPQSDSGNSARHQKRTAAYWKQ